ncbi:MAG: ABC transporter permease [Planctomycetota bacterium]
MSDVRLRRTVVVTLLAAHVALYGLFALLGFLEPLELLNVLLLLANFFVAGVLLRGRGELLVGAGVMALIAAHSFLGQRLAPDALTSGALLLVNLLILYVGIEISTHLPGAYWYAFVASYFALFLIFIVLLENAEALFLLFLLGLAATARSARLLAYFWAITLSFTFCQPFAWEATIISVLTLTAVFSARGAGRSPATLVFLGCGLALVFLVLLPVFVTMLGEDPRNVETVLRDPRIRAAIGRTLFTATASTAFLVLFAVPLAYALSRLRFRGRALLLSLIDIPIIVPQSVAGIALVRVFGKEQFLGGVLERAFGLRFDGTLLGICLAQVFVAMPFLAKSALAAFDSVAVEKELVARTLGASSWGAFLRVALPMASRGVFLGVVLAWARAAGEFGALVFIAPTPETAPVAAYNRFQSVGMVETGPLVATLLGFSLVMFFLLQFVVRVLPTARAGKEPSRAAAA